MGNERRLLDLFVPPEGFSLESLVATTYTINFDFLEEQLLPVALGIKGRTSNLPAFQSELERRLERCEVTILYDLHGANGKTRTAPGIEPISVHRRKLHAKITVLLWARSRRGERLERLARLIVGSANLTQEGFRENHEVVAYVDFGRADGAPPALLAQALDLLENRLLVISNAALSW